jgi:hypothetical protein
VEAATKSCTPQAQPAPAAASQPNWDAMANSFASLSTALTWGSILLAVIAIISGLAWGWVVAKRAENEARTEAKRCAQAVIDQWLAQEAPKIVRAHVEYLRNTSLGGEDDDSAADAMGNAAG